MWFGLPLTFKLSPFPRVFEVFFISNFQDLKADITSSKVMDCLPNLIAAFTSLYDSRREFNSIISWLSSLIFSSSIIAKAIAIHLKSSKFCSRFLFWSMWKPKNFSFNMILFDKDFVINSS